MTLPRRKNNGPEQGSLPRWSCRAALLPILDELVEVRKLHKILITTGGGTSTP